MLNSWNITWWDNVILYSSSKQRPLEKNHTQKIELRTKSHHMCVGMLVTLQ